MTSICKSSVLCNLGHHKLTISTSNDGTTWTDFPDVISSENKAKSTTLSKPIPSARYIRFIPVEWEGEHQTLRVEIIGLFKDEQGAMSSPRVSDRSVLAEKGFIDNFNSLLSLIQSSLSALMKKAERNEAEER